ncbi:ganglioside gm2 activator [Plakobranchus ocellatus]|uniref:Ganglioside gm2 activator n=1 Tax=Plakobranchus ocellatus TaxID=259542 RepID=A0AAV4CMK4_9GAST|nr:ganglioside gm2 activator [Plakobranchus ocellatus]
MRLSTIVCVCFCFITIKRSHGLRVKSCSGNPSSDIITVNWAHVYPEPLQIPGDMSLSVSVTVNQPISGDLTADVTISRKLGMMWLDLPCVKTSLGRLGSCSYHKFCDVLAQANATSTCPNILVSNKLPCICPIKAGTYTIPQTTFNLDLGFLQLPTAVISGEYQASLRLTDMSSMKEIVCYDIDVHIADPPSSKTFGSLGRFLVNLFG